MYQIFYHKNFEKSLKKLVKGGLKEGTKEDIKVTITVIASGKKLDSSYRDHKLHGEFSLYRECHIRGDLLLVYQIINKELVLIIIDIGRHNDLF